MNKVLLINRLEPRDDSNTRRKIFFMIGELNDPMVENRLIDVLHESGMVGENDFIFKYNGVELNITIQQIPKMVNKLSSNGFHIYSVFERYNPI